MAGEVDDRPRRQEGVPDAQLELVNRNPASRRPGTGRPLRAKNGRPDPDVVTCIAGTCGVRERRQRRSRARRARRIPRTMPFFRRARKGAGNARANGMPALGVPGCRLPRPAAERDRPAARRRYRGGDSGITIDSAGPRAAAPPPRIERGTARRPPRHRPRRPSRTDRGPAGSNAGPAGDERVRGCPRPPDLRRPGLRTRRAAAVVRIAAHVPQGAEISSVALNPAFSVIYITVRVTQGWAERC